MAEVESEGVLKASDVAQLYAELSPAERDELLQALLIALCRGAEGAEEVVLRYLMLLKFERIVADASLTAEEGVGDD